MIMFLDVKGKNANKWKLQLVTSTYSMIKYVMKTFGFVLFFIKNMR